MKDEVSKDPDFEIIKNGRKCTIKLVYKKTGAKYSIHPGDNAIQPLKNWMKRQRNEEIINN